MANVSAGRTVPDAPPDPSKMQKKNHRSNKTKTADSPHEGPVNLPHAAPFILVERAPEQGYLTEASEAPAIDDPILKSSPVVEILQKRLKAVNKKISRITNYASTDYQKLNADQKRTLNTLPSLKAVQKELEEVKKLVEAHEDLARELAARRADAEAARISEAAEIARVSKALGLS